jgi:hypothetical protein
VTARARDAHLQADLLEIAEGAEGSLSDVDIPPTYSAERRSEKRTKSLMRLSDERRALLIIFGAVDRQVKEC